MKFNKKGFTLIELLAVIVILAIIFAAAVPSISSSVERGKEKQLKSKIEVITAAGEVYISDNNVTDVSIVTLYCEGIIDKEELKDPYNEKNSLCGYVEKNNYSYNYVDTSSTRNNCIDISKERSENCG